MSRLIVLALVLTAAIAFGATYAMSQQEEVSAKEVVSALEGAYGVHPGERRNHTKGTCALGYFIGDPAVRRYSRAALFGGEALNIVARFSLAGGDPDASDAERSPRGMALEFRLPNGGLHHMTMINTPMFFAAVPRTFYDKMVALKPDPVTDKPDPEIFKAFLASHPDNRGQAEFLATNNPPQNYADSAYYGIHTFKFINRANKVTPVRFRFVPENGEKRLSDVELQAAPRDFLEEALIHRTEEGPARWTMMLTIGEPGDPQDDPTLLWPGGRTEISAGTLTITSAMPQPGAGCEKINFDPLVMADGIAPTNDPVLLFRSPSYALSFTRRLQGK